MTKSKQQRVVTISNKQKAILPLMLESFHTRFDVSYVMSRNVTREILLKDYEYGIRALLNDDTLELNGEVAVSSEIKVVVCWEAFGGEGFWVEVTEVVTGLDGEPYYYGKVRNDVFGDAVYGDTIGPIKRRNISKVKRDD